MGNLVEYAKSELDRIGLKHDSKDDMNRAMRTHILQMVTLFEAEGHSGFSAGYALGLLRSLLSFKPLTPLTGEDDEWIDHGDDHYQNNRCSKIFKDGKTGEAYNSEAIVFYDWYTDEKGEKHKSYFTSSDSRVPITFPYTVPESPEYRERIG